MPNTYAKLGQNIGAGEIMSAFTGGSPKAVRGYTEGITAGGEQVLRELQGGKLRAETAAILNELTAAQEARDISGVDVSEAMGIPRDIAMRVTAGETQMPGVMPPGMEGPARPVDIPAGQAEQVQRANTMRILQALTPGRGDPSAIMSSLQTQAMQDAMVSGTREPDAVADIMAAMAGKATPTSTAKLPAAKVQELNHLVKRGVPEDKAMRFVYGDPDAKLWVNMYEAMLRQIPSPRKAAEAADRGIQEIQQRRGNAGGPPGVVVKEY